jgi:hypothetical protein
LSSFTIPGTGFTFQEFKLNGSVTLGNSTTINYLNLKGGAALAGIGKANGTFAYEDSNLAFSLELAPKFPAPFKEVRASSNPSDNQGMYCMLKLSTHTAPQTLYVP